jgi:ribosomal protein L12E/L44/L45/RPP1/RPP2
LSSFDADTDDRSTTEDASAACGNETKKVRFVEQTMMYVGAVLNIEDYTDDEFSSCFLTESDLIRIKHENHVTIDRMDTQSKKPSLMTSMMSLVMRQHQQQADVAAATAAAAADDDENDADDCSAHSDSDNDDDDEKADDDSESLCERGLEWKTKVGKKRRREARNVSLHSVLDAQLCIKYDRSMFDETAGNNGESFIASEYIQHTTEAVERAYNMALKDYEDVYRCES